MRFAASLSLLALVACGGSGGGSSTPTVAVLTITSAGISSPTGSATVSIPNPGNVKFTNADTVSHNIMLSSVGGTAPTDCNPLNVGVIAAGASSAQLALINNTTANETCSFVDASNASAAFSGSITILTTNTGGSGY